MSETELKDATKTHNMYCVKCRTMVTITGPKVVTMKSNRNALQGKCPHCSTSTYKIFAKN
jgi:hypothetical protein